MKVLTDDSVGPPPKFLDDGADIRLQRRADQEIKMKLLKMITQLVLKIVNLMWIVNNIVIVKKSRP